MKKLNLNPKKYSEQREEFFDRFDDDKAWDEWWDRIINLEDINETLDSISKIENKKVWLDILKVRNCWKTDEAKMKFEEFVKSYLNKKDSTKYNNIKNHLKNNHGLSNYYMSIFNARLETILLEKQGLDDIPTNNDILQVSKILEYISKYSLEKATDNQIKEAGQKLIKDENLSNILINAFKGIDAKLTNKYLDAMDKVIEKQRLLNDVMDGNSGNNKLLFDKILDIVFDLPELYPLLFNFENLIYSKISERRRKRTKSNLFKFISLATGMRKSPEAIKVYYYDKYPPSAINKK